MKQLRVGQCGLQRTGRAQSRLVGRSWELDRCRESPIVPTERISLVQRIECHLPLAGKRKSGLFSSAANEQQQDDNQKIIRFFCHLFHVCVRF